MLRHLDRKAEALEAVKLATTRATRSTCGRWPSAGWQPAADEDTLILVETMLAHPATGPGDGGRVPERRPLAGWPRPCFPGWSSMYPSQVRTLPVGLLRPGLFRRQAGKLDKPAAYFRKIAQRLSPDYVFPFQFEAIDVLEAP